MMPPTPKPNNPAQAPAYKLTMSNIAKSNAGHRIVLYGTGGVGKSTLACMMPGPVKFVDADESLSRLCVQLEEGGIELPQVVNVGNYSDLRAALRSDWGKTKTVVIDSITKSEEWIISHTLKTVKSVDTGNSVNSIEGYGYGKGFQFVFDTFLPLLGDLDRLARKGIHIVLIAHECTQTVPNPEGLDWLRYEPRLQNPSTGKASIRLRLKEWADHVLFMGRDIVVKDSVGKAGEARRLITSEQPFCMAKSRTTQEEIVIEQNVSPWEKILR